METKDKLDIIFEMQNKFDSDLVKNRGLENITREEWIQKEVLAMLSELSELLDEVNWKWWKNKKEVNEDTLKEEIVDVLHFFVSTCIKSGMDADELYKRYLAKNEENFKRQYGTSTKQGYNITENND